MMLTNAISDCDHCTWQLCELHLQRCPDILYFEDDSLACCTLGVYFRCTVAGWCNNALTALDIDNVIGKGGEKNVMGFSLQVLLIVTSLIFGDS